MLKTSLILAFLLMVLLTGCLSSGKEHTHESVSTKGELRLSDCHGAGTVFLAPTSLSSGPTPKGWEGGFPINSISIDLMECNRLSIDNFERGPLRIMREYHTAFNENERCRGGEKHGREMLTKLWVDDSELSQHLARVYGLPTEYSTIVTMPLTNHAATWMWNISNEQASSLEFHSEVKIPRHIPDNNQNETRTVSSRLYWFNETNLYYMDVVEEWLSSTGYTKGILKPPMIYSRYGLEAYAGLGHIFSYEMIGAIKGFSDYKCKEPLPP